MTRRHNERRMSWTFTMLTIPAREEYLANLLRSIAALPRRTRCEIVVVYNAATNEEHSTVEQRICAMAPTLPIRVYINSTDPTIGGGRRLQLSVCRTPLVAFVDDDLTLHGDVLGTLERALAGQPLGIVGLPSYNEDTAEQFKPRESTPYVNLDGIRYMPVQGMLVAGYRRLFCDIGGFNPRRQFWGEWTELNLRMWRHGYPTGYAMDGAFLRHWHKAPESPTRNMAGRERHVLWGLICTALEYDAVSVNDATEAFWRLAQDRYLAYSFGEQPTPRQLLASVLELMPRLSSEFPAIHAFAQEARTHPFHFKPFEPFTAEQVRSVLAYAEQAVHAYRPDMMDAPIAGEPRRMRSAMFAAMFGAAAYALLGCSGADRGRPAESAAALVTPSPDTARAPAPIASDATLVIEADPAIVEALRAVCDSFASREAIEIQFTAPAELARTAMADASQLSDLVIVAGTPAPRLPDDSSSWALPFAAWPPRGADSVASPARAQPRDPASSALVLTIPSRAPNSGVAERFVRYMLTDGRATLKRAGVELLPRLVVHGEDGPPGIRSVVDTVIPRGAPPAGDSVPPA